MRPPRRARTLCALAAGFGLFAATTSHAFSLQEAWNVFALPGEGYDRVLHLDSLAVYTGGLTLTSGTNCIHGHGAILDLGGISIRAMNYRTVLDIDACVILNGPRTSGGSALSYTYAAAGRVQNCVFYGNRIGLHMREVNVNATAVRNCIFMHNDEWGAVLHDVYTPPLEHCAAHENGVNQPPGEGGNYALWCGCSSIPLEAYVPPAEAHCLACDPLFVHPTSDAALCDFHLRPGSECLEAGDPPGTHIGAYQEAITATEPATWGRIKARFTGR